MYSDQTCIEFYLLIIIMSHTLFTIQEIYFWLDYQNYASVTGNSKPDVQITSRYTLGCRINQSMAGQCSNKYRYIAGDVSTLNLWITVTLRVCVCVWTKSSQQKPVLICITISTRHLWFTDRSIESPLELLLWGSYQNFLCFSSWHNCFGNFSSILSSQILNMHRIRLKDPEGTHLQGIQVAMYHQQIKTRKISSRIIMIFIK